MGILAEPLQYIRDLDFEIGFSVCELGDQWVTCQGTHRLARKFYEELGCNRYESIDGNGRGTLTVDLNLPIEKWPIGVSTSEWIRGFDIVTDFGTGEHIFDQLQVWRTMHMLTKVGGCIVFDRPCAGYEGHCFYLIQPNLIAAVAWANCYEVVAFERAQTTRGHLVRGVLRKTNNQRFMVPQQGRYHKDLKPILSSDLKIRGPDHKSKALRDAGVIRRGVGDVVSCEDSEEDIESLHADHWMRG